MEGGLETVAAGEGILQGFYLRIDHFDIAAAAFTDKVIMMGIPGVFVAGQPIPEAHFAGESGLAKQLHGPVDRGLPEGRVFTVNPIIDFFGGKMPVFIEEDLHDPLTLRRIAQSLGFQEMTEDVDRIGPGTGL